MRKKVASLCVPTPSAVSGQCMTCCVVRCTSTFSGIWVADGLTDQSRVWSSGILGVVRQVGLIALSRKMLVVTKPVQLITMPDRK